MIQLRCPCGYERPVPELYDGPDIRCPNCGKTMPIPVKPPPPPIPARWFFAGLGAAAVGGWLILQGSGFLTVEIPDLEAFDLTRGPAACAYRECAEPSSGILPVRVAFVPSGIAAPVYEDRGLALCAGHADCARERSWGASTPLKHPLQLVLSVLFAAVMIGVPCIVLHVTGRFSLPRILTGKTG